MARTVGEYTIHEVAPGLDAWCSKTGVTLASQDGGALAHIRASLNLLDRDAVLRLASILAEAAEAMPVVEVSNG